MNEKASLLIVDDEHGPAESLRMIFKPSYHVHVARGGEEALDIIRREAIDVVTLDLRMPQISGVEVLRRIKQTDPDIEVIIVTGYSSLDSALHGLRHGAFDYIAKPFDVPKIAELVQHALERRRTRLRGRRTREDFLANLSHELRTPLNAILGYSSILGDELHRKLDAEQEVALQRIHHNAMELLNLVESVMLLNSLDAGELSLELQSFDPTEVVRKAASRFMDAARDKGLSIELESSVEGLSLHSDPDKLHSVLTAMLDNAVKFTSSGILRISMSQNREVGGIEIQLRDTGIGMDPAQLEHILEGVVEGNSSARHQYRGLGIGLRLAHQLMSMLGGDLAITSAVNCGTLVTLTLPSWRTGTAAELH